MARFPVIIGRTEKMAIADLVLGVPAKIDTGAYRSAIHANSIRKMKRNGKTILKVQLLGHPCSPDIYKLEFNEFEKVKVTNSFGHEEERYEVKLRIKLGPKVLDTSFTLADRSKNLFPILIGRKTLKGRYFIDVASAGIDRLALKKEFNFDAPIDDEDMED